MELLLLLLGGYLGGENSVGGFSPMRRRLPTPLVSTRTTIELSVLTLLCAIARAGGFAKMSSNMVTHGEAGGSFRNRGSLAAVPACDVKAQRPLWRRLDDTGLDYICLT